MFRALLGVLVLASLWVAAVSSYRASLPEGCPPVLRLGWAHWRRCLLSARGHVDPTQQIEPYPLKTNLHRVPVAGTGLCLYYNSLAFMIAFTLLMVILLGPVWVYAPVFFFDDEDGGTCQHPTDAAIDAASSELVDVQSMLGLFLAIAWACLEIGSLLFAWYQRREFKNFDATTSLMADFAIQATGFPADATEAEIRDWGRFASDRCPLVGVSIAYDYSHRIDWVNEVLGMELERQELYWWRVKDPDDESSMGWDKDPRTNTEQVKWVLKSFKGSGTAFLVFESEVARACFYQAFSAAEEAKFRGCHAITMRSVVGEPVSFQWDAFGTDWKEFATNCVREFGIVLVAGFLLSFLGYLPATYYMLHLAHHSGSEDELDLTTSLLGVLLACLNSILSVAINRAVHRIGLPAKWMADAANMAGCVFITGLNTCFNLAISHSAAASSHRLLLLSDGRGQILRDYAWRRVMADTLWNLMMPGLLVLPYLLRPLLYILCARANYYYYISLPFGKLLSMRDLRTDALVELRDVERKLEPQAIHIEFDYASIIIVHSSALIFLFFETGHMVMAGCVLLFWVMFTYASQVYCHLRWSKMVEYTDPFLADSFNFALAIPISIVAAASVYWDVQSGSVGEGLPLVAFFLAMVTHWFLLVLVLLNAPLNSDLGTANYEDTRARLLYDYFNTNPVHVLREVFLEGRNVIPFQRGKEYLQRGMPKILRQENAGIQKLNQVQKNQRSIRKLHTGACC